MWKLFSTMVPKRRKAAGSNRKRYPAEQTTGKEKKPKQTNIVIPFENIKTTTVQIQF